MLEVPSAEVPQPSSHFSLFIILGVSGTVLLILGAVVGIVIWQKKFKKPPSSSGYTLVNDPAEPEEEGFQLELKEA